MLRVLDRGKASLAILGTAGVLAWAGVARAQSQPDDELRELRLTLRHQIEALKKQQDRLARELTRLDQKSELLDRQLQKLRATGTTSSTAVAVGGGAVSVPSRPQPAQPGPSEAPTAVAEAAPPTRAEATPTAAPEGTAAPISGPSAREQQARRVLETAPTLSNTGGVLTPKGQFVVDPSFEFDYIGQNQLGVNGFQIIPGITFGNIFVNRVEQNIGTAAVTLRAGVTNRLEVNMKIPYVITYGSTTSLIPEGATAQLLTSTANNYAVGDIQLGASYQINNGQGGWPIFVGNLLFKTATGVSPFDVPIITLNDPNGEFLQGIPKKLATGTGFYSVQPSVTMLYPTAPGILFANLLYINNIGRTVDIPNNTGGPGTPAHLTPGQGLALTFGIGFALNDRASMTLSYQQEHIFTAHENGAAITGSSYSFGTFDFAVGYEISHSTRINVSVGIGVGPNTPAAKVLIEIPYRFSL